MLLPLRERVRTALLRYVEVPGARLLAAAGVAPNTITLLGLLLAFASAVLVGFGALLAGGLVFLAAGALDLMDGAVARYTGRVSPLGALLDSTFDRLGEAALYMGLAVYGVLNQPTQGALVTHMVVLVAALATSQTVSYLRARGESLGIDTRAGLMTRAERVLILSVGVMLGLVVPAMAVVAVLSTVTLLERLARIARDLQGR